MILFSRRKKIAGKINKWIADYNIEYSTLSVISGLQIMGYLHDPERSSIPEARHAHEMRIAITQFCQEYENKGIQTRLCEMRAKLRPLLALLAKEEQE